MKRTPIRPRRATPRRRTAPTWDRDDWEAASWVLTTRANGCCERCGRPLRPDWSSRHHRMRRRDGGDTYPNLMLLCGDGTTGCHGFVTEHPAEAREQGWIVFWPTDPATVPVRLADGYLWYLREDGTKVPVP